MPQVTIAAMLSLLPMLLLLCVGQLDAAQPSVNLGSYVVYGSSTQVGFTKVDKYLGIRFGEPPTGDLRFRKPEPAKLDGVVNATVHGSPCLGSPLFQMPGMDEDCLFLDVYVPRNSEGTGGRLPVLMWIYGGAFIFGANSGYKGEVLAAEGNVILVAPNYRLGPFGFLSTGDNSSLGNYGLWDQWLALKWVRDNIKQFGGDVNSITLYGESAGSASVSHHMTSPYSTGLFHRAILQSGCRLCYWAYNSSFSPLEQANKVASVANCDTATENDAESTARLVSCLQQKSVQDINRIYYSSMTEWMPVIDGDFVLPFTSAPKFAGSVMAGLNNREGGFALGFLKQSQNSVNDRTFYNNTLLKVQLGKVYHELTTSVDPRDVQKVVEAFDDMYEVPGVSNDTYVPDEELEAVLGDAMFFVCNKELFDNQPSSGSASYLFYFDHYPEFPEGKKGMNHAMDLDYAFGFSRGLAVSDFAGHNVTDKDVDLGVHFRSILTNFAHSGNPYKPRPLPDKWPSWPVYKQGEESYLSVSFSPAVCNQLKKNRMNFWLKTVPSLLQGQGPQQFDKTRFHRCVRPTGAAASVDVTKIVFLLCLVFLSIL